MFSNSMLLTIQHSAALISLIGALVVVGVVLFLFTTSDQGDEKHEAKKMVYALRGKYFLGLAAVIVVGLVITLGMLPYPKFQTEAPDQTIVVVGSQWSWKMGPGELPAEPKKFKGKSTITLPPGKTIQFLVTASDVTHNFAIYNEQGVLLAQTQAMPGYWNDLRYTFAQGGTFKVLCLEYCGAPHTVMTGKIVVEQ